MIRFGERVVYKCPAQPSIFDGSQGALWEETPGHYSIMWDVDSAVHEWTVRHNKQRCYPVPKDRVIFLDQELKYDPAQAGDREDDI